MKKIVIAGSFVVLMAGVVASLAQEAGQLPPGPTKEHEWLEQLVGEWESKSEATLVPGEAPIQCEGTETVRSIGGRWILAENNNTIMGLEMKGVMTVGYDPQKKKYIGTWIDSMTDHLWKYEGTLDETGKILTLEAEGPDFMNPGKTRNYRDAIEVKSKDHKILKSSVQGDDGEWTTFMTANYRRKG